MSSPTAASPEYRLRNLRRELKNLVMSRRLAADPERTGVVELADFGAKCDALAELAAQSVTELAGAPGARWLAEELELAARVAARLETLPKSPQRVERQCEVLEEVARGIDAAIAAEGGLEETTALTSLAALAREERKLFEPFLAFTGRIEETPAGLVERGPIRRALRRALLDHEEGGEPFTLATSHDGTLRFSDLSFRTEAAGAGIPRSPGEPPEVKKALDMREASPDEALGDFLLVKAVDEALGALLKPRLTGADLVEAARALPARPGKRRTVRPEAVRKDIAGWDVAEAARVADKLAAHRLGPDGARLPRGAYVLRLFVEEDDELAADLIALGTALRRMEKGEAVPDTGARAERALRSLLGLLG